MSHLLNFYGAECPHCKKMEPLIQALEEKEGIVIDRLEVWSDEGNMSMLEGYDKGRCGGVPFFYNTKTDAYICGEATYEQLEVWAKDN